MYTVKNFKDLDLNVDYYDQLLDLSLSEMWYTYLLNFFNLEEKREGLIIGDPNIIYKVTYRGKTSKYLVIPWDKIHPLYELKTLVEKITNQIYTVCVIQVYPNGKVGIAKHRDKEMVSGTRICGVSLGAKRTIQFSRTGFKSLKLELNSGSMYVMNDPTNNYWLHEILKSSKVKNPRISLTFRDYH